jgi:hypothetical protein
MSGLRTDYTVLPVRTVTVEDGDINTASFQNAVEKAARLQKEKEEELRKAFPRKLSKVDVDAVKSIFD